MTHFYRFDSRADFLAAGGKDASEYVADGVGVSVIGERYEDAPDPMPEDYEPVVIEFLVNTTQAIDGWPEVQPNQPMRIFG